MSPCSFNSGIQSKGLLIRCLSRLPPLYFYSLDPVPPASMPMMPREAWVPVLEVKTTSGVYVGTIWWGYKFRRLSAHCLYCEPGAALPDGPKWGSHGVCRCDRVCSEEGIPWKGRPLAFLVCWLRRAVDASDQQYHLKNIPKSITKRDRLQVRTEFCDDSEFKSVSVAFERKRRLGEPLEHDKNP